TDGVLFDSDPEKDHAKANAWSAFVALHGGPRAAWLARTFQAHKDAAGKFAVTRPSDRLIEPDFGRVRGFPKTIELWMERGGNKPERVGTTTPLLTDRLKLDFPNGLEDDRRWWSSWDEAVIVGLGVEIDLGLQ